MHREISHTDPTFEQESNLPLYFLTGLLGVLMAADLLPRLATWLGVPSWAPWPTGTGEFRWAFLAAILGGARVVTSSLSSLFEGKIGADLALAIACLAAILINEPLVAAEVVLIGMIGECLEAITFSRTQSAVRKLVEVFPLRCWRLQDGVETRVFTKDLQAGDFVVVKPGAKIPVDGVVTEGRSAINLAALTGESLPVDKGVGDEVLAGAINQLGALTIRAERVAQQTVAGQVIELTSKALQKKADIERTADRLARYFLPVVLGLALVTFAACLFYFGTTMLRPNGARLSWRIAATYSLYPTLSVLVVACPCALILATPAAIIAALGRLAGTGVLIKGGAALERLAKVGAWAFDKTGTLTEGKLEVGDVQTFGGAGVDEVLALAASAEQKSEHPLAQLVLEEARRRQLPLASIDSFQALPGAGIQAEMGQQSILVGTRRLFEDRGIVIPAEVERALEASDAAGQTPLLVSRQGTIIGLIGARDRLRPEAIGVVDDLKQIGIDPVVLLTGDRQAVASSIARDVALTSIHAELLPADKAEHLQRLKSAANPGRPLVAMVGDGINDAPALAQADVGIALGGVGVDLAAEAGDIVMMGDPLRPLPMLVRLSRETVKIIQQNIYWFAFGANLLGILLTSWLWPLFTPENWFEQSPLAAAIYHQFGSLAVLLNSMRLLWFERTDSSPSWSRAKNLLRKADVWAARYADGHEFLHWLVDHRRALGRGVLALLLLMVLLSGWTMVSPDEVGVVRRFGHAITDLGPGWYLRWPAPIEDVVVVSQKVRTIEVGFRIAERAKAAPSLTWSSAHMQENRIEEEAMMMTGDGNLVDLLVSVRYRVTHPRVFAFEIRDPENVIRSSTESVLRELAAGRAFFELLTVQRGKFQAEVLQRLEDRCAGYTSVGLGVHFEGVAIIDLHPPKAVVDSYYEVARAMELRDKRVNDARSKAVGQLKNAEAEHQKIVAQARAMSAEKVRQAEGEAARFTERLRGRQLSFDQEFRLQLWAAEQALSGRSGADVERDWQARRLSLQVLQRSLSDFATYWDGVGRALQGREMLLIDTDKIGGRRNLMLFDPEMFRPPPPIVLPNERVPRTPFRSTPDEP